MDNGSFGPLTGAEEDTPDDVTDTRSVVEQLAKEKERMEAEFGQKRAKFMELFKQKEDELVKVTSLLSEEVKKNEGKDQQIGRLQTEVDDINTATAISEATKEEYVIEMQRKFQEEVKSLQRIMRESVDQAHQAAAEKFEEEHSKLLMDYDTMDKELQDTKNKLAQEGSVSLHPFNEGFLTSVTKTIQKKVGAVTVAGQSVSEQESLEDSMKRAKEDAEILKSVVLPLEEEIQSLKAQLRTANITISRLDGRPVDEVVKDSAATSLPEGSAELDVRLAELNKSLEVEKASRSDLEMYVAVINTQKNVLQEDNEKLVSQLQEVVRNWGLEKQEHTNLKHTWQMANDQFLQAQRLWMTDVQHMESVLTSEQQKQISELKNKDAELAKKEQEEQKHKPDEAAAGVDQTDSKAASESHPNSKGSMTSLTSEELSKVEDDSSISAAAPTAVVTSPASTTNTPSGLARSQSDQSLQSITKELFDSGMNDTRSLQEDSSLLRFSPDRSFQVHNLTEAQQKAITDPTSTAEASQQLIASIKAKSDTISTIGKRLVSEREWNMLQKEMRAAREKLGRPCDMCHNYEDQIQSLQENEKKAQGQVRTLERHLQAERQANTNQQCYIEELEQNLKEVAGSSSQEMSTLTTKLIGSETFVGEIRQHFIHAQTDLQHHLRTLTGDRESINKELIRLQDENDSLVSKHSKHAQQLQEECINLPNNLEEMQLLLLKYREEIISAKVAKEHTEETLRSEIMFIKDQLLCEQQEKSNLEEAMTQEISQLQSDLAEHQAVRTDLDQTKLKKQELENRVRESDSQLKSLHEKGQKAISGLQGQIKELTDSKQRLEQEVSKMRVKVSGLQVDLDNSEAVQRDFVKLSQSLQIQLEKIRAAEHEVRWQHEEDIEECNNCRLGFSVTRRKHHCRHCGKLFCNDCLPKIVNSGPHLRPSRVCDVCHTILVRDATPYFSTDLPQMPD